MWTILRQIIYLLILPYIANAAISLGITFILIFQKRYFGHPDEEPQPRPETDQEVLEG